MFWGKSALAGLAIFGLCQCSSGEEQEAAYDRAEKVAASAVAGTTYADQGSPYGCTVDCSGHDAGYAWADRNEVRDPSDCGGNSRSFIEGCMAYAEAYQAAVNDAL